MIPPTIRTKTKRLPADARRLALMVLNRVGKEDRTLDGVMEGIYGRSVLSNPDQRLFHAVVYGVLRWRAFLDHVIAHFSKIPMEKVSPEVLNILRIGLFQMIHLDKIPVSAAVNTSVEMTKTIASPWISGYVNAVLRKAAKGYHQVPFPDKKDPVSHLSVFESFPAWLVSRWIKRIGFDATERLCKSINQIPSIVVRANTLKTTVQHLRSALVPLAENVHICEFSPVGIFFSNPRIPVGRMKPFLDGWFQVQDEAAQLVTGLLNPQPGERIMDACSGQGGKTGHIAQTMENRGRIVAVDWNEDKLSKLNKEMDRLGVSNVTGMKCDLSRPLENEFADAFHRILLDAPCSGLGVLRRNPEAKWRVLETDLKRYRNTQLQMLHHLCRCVRPSGVLVYAVCSMEPEENEDVIDRFLKEHSNFALRQIHPEISEQGNSLLDKRGYLKTSPGMHPMDGFFGACLQRLT